jgi:RimJ/RimL family protein N-acetyltransferase
MTLKPTARIRNAQNAPESITHSGSDIQLESKNYIFRPLKPTDASERYIAWLNDSDLQNKLGRPLRKWNKAQAQNHIKQFNNQDSIHLGIFSKEDGLPIGYCSVFLIRNDSVSIVPVIGHHESRLPEIYEEIGRRIQEFVFDELEYNKITIRVNSHNTDLLNMSKKLNMTTEAVLREHYKEPGGARPDEIHIGQLRREWLEAKVSR